MGVLGGLSGISGISGKVNNGHESPGPKIANFENVTQRVIQFVHSLARKFTAPQPLIPSSALAPFIRLLEGPSWLVPPWMLCKFQEMVGANYCEENVTDRALLLKGNADSLSPFLKTLFNPNSYKIAPARV